MNLGAGWLRLARAIEAIATGEAAVPMIQLLWPKTHPERRAICR